MKIVAKSLIALWLVGGLAACTPRDAEPIPDNHAVASPTPVTWTDAPVILAASLDHTTGEQHAAEQTTPAPVVFTIPDAVYVRTGNAGNGQVQFQFGTATGVSSCTFQGGADVPHPTTDLQRMHGRRYLFSSCDSGQAAGQTASATWFSLRVLGGDSQDPSGITSASLHLGGGCSDALPAPIAADEVVALREGFSWQTIAKLPETDVDGYPAMFHGLIYIDSKAQLAALDRLHVYWSAQPLSERYMSGLRGKCGRVEHATDGRGVVVYAVFPAQLFNVMRDFALQSLNGNAAPPFRFIIPSPPDQPEYVNADGSIKYSALASSGFAQWLATRAPQQPIDWNPTSWPGAVSDAATDAYDWAKDHVVDPAVHYGEYGFDYLTKGFDAAIDWTANFLDDAWEATQQGLGKLVGLFSDKVTLRLKITMLERDRQFPPGSTLTRVWGPPDASGARPNIVPAGAHVRVRQWGWGFLPIMDQNQLSEAGEVSLRPIKGASGRGGDLCVEMDTDYGMITTDFIPNEVCDFAEGRYGSYQRDFDYHRDPEANLMINQADLYGLTQIKDSADYFKTVEGAKTYTFDVLTGWVANEMTKIISKQHRAMTLCLDFPSTGASAITVAAGALGAAGALAGPVVGAITTGLGLVGASLIEKDLWWPDADDVDGARRSRGVMTHEYGHFTMCSLLFAQNGPPGLTGLIARVFEGQDDARGDEVALMTESWADTFAMQVVGGANYIQGGNATWGEMNFCTMSPCMDENFTGNNEYLGGSGGAFRDELARFESLIQDAFDTADPARRFTNAPGNGDVWTRDAKRLLVVSSVPYLSDEDERVSLDGQAWKRWVKRWLERGIKPSKANVIGGLVQTMADEGYNWCDRCELLALHDKTTDPAAYDADPTGHGAPTMSQRYARWLSCTRSSDIKSWLGPAPAPNLNMNSACTPCPLHNFVDSNGTCQPCPSDSVGVGDHCYQCEYGPAKDSEMCIIG